MKEKLFLTITLISLMLFTFSACTSTENEVENEAKIPNPIEAMASLDAIDEQLGFTFEGLPQEAENRTYFIIAKTLAQVDFTLDSIDYTARKGLISEDDISGVYTILENGQTIMDDHGHVVFYDYNNEGQGRATWQTDTYDYSVVCSEGFDLTAMKAIVNGLS